MWVLDPPGGYPRKTRFLNETLGESVPGGPKIGVFWHPAALRFQRQGPSAGCDPMGVVEGPCGYSAG